MRHETSAKIPKSGDMRHETSAKIPKSGDMRHEINTIRLKLRTKILKSGHKASKSIIQSIIVPSREG